MKDAVYFQMTGDVEAGDRLPAPHPELIKYFDPPREVVNEAKASGTIAKLIEMMDVKKGMWTLDRSR